ncbi:MAG: hypothetical protein GXO10_01775 [Crenarchaeota archaeon]|nr:hypothetical protein [Thermoproteota archaeon]
MSCKIYRIRHGKRINVKKNPEKLLKLVLEGKHEELLIEVDENILSE